MAATASTMLPLGTPLPDFSLTNAVDGKTMSLTDVASKKALLVMFICNHCPYVIHVRDEITRLAHEYLRRDVGVVAINSNSIISHPEDGPDEMKKLALGLGWQFPFLFDETQEVARAFQAACTPEFYLFDEQRKLVYRGQLDDSRPGNNKPVTGRDLREALEAVIEGRPVAGEQRASVGCNIKWKPLRESAR